MEIFVDYGLVLVFFILVPIFVVVVLSTHPYSEPSKAATSGQLALKQVGSFQRRDTDNKNSKIAYIALAIIFIGLCMMTVLSERS